MIAAGKLWLQDRKTICQTRHKFLRDYARRQALKVSISLDELFEFIDDPDLQNELTKRFEEAIEEVNRPFFDALERALAENPDADIDALFEELERDYLVEDEPEPCFVFVSPAVTVRRTSPNAHRGVGHGSSGTGNKDPSDPDGDGDGGDGDSNSLCRCLTWATSRSPVLAASDGHNKNARVRNAGEPLHERSDLSCTTF